jgi:hypothetical protein
LIELVDDEDLIPFARRALGEVDQDPAALSLALYRTIVLDRLSAGQSALRACLLTVADVAPRLARSHQSSLLGRCIDLLARPFDPYQPPVLDLPAREAASALLVADSSLDEQVLAAIRGHSPGTQALLDIMGATVRARDTDRSGSVAAVLEAWRPGAEEAFSFCGLADTGFSATEAVIARGPERRAPRASAFAIWAARHLAPAAIGPALCGALLIARSSIDVPDGPPVAPGVALGALALLLATHVVSAQLSAERLPGSLARFSSQPPSVVAGYSAGFTMVAASLISLSAKQNHLWRQVATAELALFALFLGATLVTLVRRTDTTAAAVGFARDQGSRFAASGRRMGKIQAASLEASEELKALPWARVGGSEPLNERRETIRARSNGFSSIDTGRLAALTNREPWRARELTLHVGGGLGTLVHRDSELASIIPSRQARLPRAELRAARAAFRVHSESRVEECAEALSALTGLCADLAAQGNPGGSNRVADALIDLLGSHLRACHQARGEDPATASGELYPVNLGLRSVLLTSVRRIGVARNAEERQVLGTVVRRALALSTAGDAAVTIAVNALPGPGERALSAEELAVIWDAGSRALAFGANVQTMFVNGDLGRRMKKGTAQFTTPMEIAARLTTLHVWVDQLSADRRWEWFWEDSAAADAPRERVLSAFRIGSAALLAGCSSVALKVALALEGEDLSRWRDYLKNEGVSQWESFLSQQHGYLLGPDPEFAMVQFVDFAARVQAAVG